MNYKIACPLCQHSFSLKDPKPGQYKPKCSACLQAFGLIVESGDPVQIKVGKLAKTVAKPMDQTQDVEPAPTRLTASDALQATLPSEVSPQVSGITSVSSAVGLDATMERSDDQDFSVNEATMDSNVGLASTSSVGKDSVGKDSASKDSASKDSASNDSASKDSASKGASMKASEGARSSAPAGTNASSPALMLNRLGGYKILSELGAGGMGSVYLAKQISLDRSCALKTIQAHWAKNPRVIARFIREAYAAAQLTHHNVVQIYDLGQDSGTNYFSMELVSGGSLDDQLKSKGKLPPKLAATLILQASRGLKFAHDHGMVHRDIKPANLMMTADGLVKVADMGLIKTPSPDDLPPEDDSDVQSMMLASARSQVTAVGSSMGTPAYMSPEQSLDAASVDKRADIYSLGCTFYALLTGKPPFDGNTLMEVISKHRAEKIVRPERIISGLPTTLGDIIEKMTEKKPEDRYQDLEEVIHDLEVYLELREDTSKAQIIHQPSSPDEILAGQKHVEMNDKPAKAEPVIPPELAGQLKIASKRFSSSPVLIARRFLPMAWNVACGLGAAMTLIFALWAGLSLLGEGAKSLASQANNVVQGLGATPQAELSAAQATQAVAANAAPTVSKATEYYSSMASWLKTTIGIVLAMFLAPVSAVTFSGLEGTSPLARRWRESLITGGVLEWLYWLFGGLIGLLAVHYLGLWMPLIFASVLGVGAGAGYYFGIEKMLSKQRKPSLDQAQGILRQLRFRGMDEDQICNATVQQASPNWEEFFESLFGYDRMRTMRAKLQGIQSSDGKTHPSRRDKMIDRWDAKLSEAKREKDEKVLRLAGKAEMIAEGVSEAEAGKRATELAASMVEAAHETRQAMHDIATGKLTVHAAEAKRQRIKQMLAEARSGKVSKREVRNRSLDRLLGQLLGSKFRFVCAAVLFLGVGMWLQTNQQATQGYWQQARSTIDSLKNTKLDSSAIESAKNAIATASQQTQAGGTKAWKSIWFGSISQKNVVWVTLAAMVMLFGTMLSGWKKSLLLIPIVLALCAIPLWL